jgi:3-deoxy-D-manno-octulosonic-acid transferase
MKTGTPPWCCPKRTEFWRLCCASWRATYEKNLLNRPAAWKIHAVRLIYNLLLPVLFLLSSPYYIWRLCRRPGWRSGFKQRFGYYGEEIQNFAIGREVIWLHAVSVGEINLCVELVRALESKWPRYRYLVSTTTTTGMAELNRKLGGHVAKVYFPVDLSGCVRRALEIVKPRAVIFLEAEIWPNFIWQTTDRRLPLCLVNARISDRSYPRYLKFKFFFKDLFQAFTLVCAQSDDYATRFTDAGCRPENVMVTGNIKFDTAKISGQSGPDASVLLAQAGFPVDAQILVGGSTHDGEEKMLACLFQRLRERFPRLYLVIVPRHFERARSVGRNLETTGIKYLFRSKLSPSTKMEPGTVDCLVVDSTGELMSFYTQATVVFIGKSILAKGGQNPIEPAALGRATVFGPNMQNFTDVVRIFLTGKGVVQVKSVVMLERAIEALLVDPQAAAKLGERGRQIVVENQGALQRTVALLSKHLDPTPLAGND